MVIWITGLSGAGKTTLALEIVAKIKEKSQPVIFLDGDQLRQVLGDAEVTPGVASAASEHPRPVRGGGTSDSLPRRRRDCGKRQG